jgi:hypothetical protein
MATATPDPQSNNENRTVIDVLRQYSTTNQKKGQILAEYLDFLEDCFSYEVDLRPDYGN